jgi:phenylacetate-coenzyme A ligase PaaK-like adenylate-forming protein
MEYGSVECGLMAHTRPSDGNYFVFWNTRLLQADKQGEGQYRNLVTRLTRTYVPLIRYDIGDYLELNPNEDDNSARSVLVAKSIIGRPSEMITFHSGVSFFGALVGDCVKQVSEVIASQIAVDEEHDKLEIRVTASCRLSQEKLEVIENRFRLTVANAEKIDIRVSQVDSLTTTAGGKTPRVVRLNQ